MNVEFDPTPTMLEDLAATGIHLRTGPRFDRGETRTARSVIDDQGQEWVLKWSEATTDSMENLERLVAVVDRLRGSGYPAPRHLAWDRSNSGRIGYRSVCRANPSIRPRGPCQTTLSWRGLRVS